MAENKKRKRRGKEEIKKEILKFFEKQTFPRTTGQIARAIRLNWYSTTFYLNALKSEGKLFHEKVGRQNQWWIEHVGEITKEVKILRKKVKEMEEEIRRLKKRI